MLHTTQTTAEQRKRIRKVKQDFAAFCTTYFEDMVSARIPQFHIRSAYNFLDIKHPIMCERVFRSGGKSTMMRLKLLWRLMHGVPTRAVIIGSTEDAAERHLKALRTQLEWNEKLLTDLGPQRGYTTWTDHEIETLHGDTFWAFGQNSSNFRGLQNSRGQRPNVFVFDDFDRTDVCRNPELVDKVWNDTVWGDIYGMRDPRYDTPIVVVGNPIADDCIANRFKERALELSGEDAVLEVPIMDEHGNPNWPEMADRAKIEEIRSVQTVHRWETEYMLNPISPDQWFQENWANYQVLRPWGDYHKLCMYLDPSHREHKRSDFKAAALWGLWQDRGGQWRYDKIDCYLDRGSKQNWIDWVFRRYLDLPEEAKRKLMIYSEGMFNQGLYVEEFKRQALERGIDLPISEDREHKGNKEERISQMEILFNDTRIRWNADKADNLHFKRAETQYRSYNPI
jgi:hypothetical protein